MEKIKNSKTFPNKQHYAIMIFDTKSVYHEGDERSRTNPGHGYPAHTETFDNFEYLSYDMTDKESWEKKIIELHKEVGYYKKDFVAFIGQPKVEINTEVKINLNT